MTSISIRSDSPSQFTNSNQNAPFGPSGPIEYIVSIQTAINYKLNLYIKEQEHHKL